MKLKPKDVEKIKRLKACGLKISEIAKIMGVSERRIFQILKAGKVEIPGRKKKKLPKKIVKTILELREQGFRISSIKRELEQRGIAISRYKIWDTLHEHEMKTLHENLKKSFSTYDRVFLMSILTVVVKKKKRKLRYKLLVVGNMNECRACFWTVKRKLTLGDVISIIDEVLAKEISQGFSILVYISKVPPVVPTKGNENKLTRHLTKLGVAYAWIEHPLAKKVQRRVARKIRRELERENPKNVEEWINSTGINIFKRECFSFFSEIARWDKNGDNRSN
ncbi:hypothetical protein [Thermococcus sp.]